MQHDVKTSSKTSHTVNMTSHTVNITAEDLTRWLRRKEGLPHGVIPSITLEIPYGTEGVTKLSELGGINVSWEVIVDEDHGR